MIEPRETALRHLNSMRPELDRVISLAMLPPETGAVHGTVAQGVLSGVQAGGLLPFDLDVSAWRPARTSFYWQETEREAALAADLVSELYAKLLNRNK